MDLRHLRPTSSDRSLWWAGSIAILGIAMIVAIVVKTAAPTRTFGLDGQARLLSQGSRDLEKPAAAASGQIWALPNETALSTPGSPSVQGPGGTASPAPSPAGSPLPKAKKARPPNPSDPLARYAQPIDEDGQPFNSGGPIVGCELMNNTPAKLVKRGETVTMGCTVTSKFGFSAPSTLECGDHANKVPLATAVKPGLIPCSFDPPVVTPPADGTAKSTLTFRVPLDLPYDTYSLGFRVDSPGAQLFIPPVWPLNIDVRRPELYADCGSEVVQVVRGGDWADLTCRVTVAADFDDVVEIIQSNLEYSPTDQYQHRTDVASLNFGPEGGTQEFVLSARALAGAGPSEGVWVGIRNLSRTSMRSASIFVRIEIVQ